MAAPRGIPSDSQLVARAVGDLTRRTRFPVAFGGLTAGEAIHVSSVAGARTRSLDGLVVRSGRGLGGRALVERRPRLAVDYRSARGITHDYDGAVLGEGIATLLAVPVVVADRTRGVLYCGSWSPAPIGDAVAAPAFQVADELAAELRARDEAHAGHEVPARDGLGGRDDVRRRLVPADSADGSAEASVLSVASREALRESYAELRSIGASVRDAELRERLARVERKLAALAQDRDASGPDLEVRLSPRELDVLACAALGATNAEIAVTLTLREVTVKSYLHAAMAKLDASTRHAAVRKARRAGLLP